MKLYMHVGLGKTGTSYIQAALANSLQELADQGVDYPVRKGVLARAQNGEITSGNCRPDFGDIRNRARVSQRAGFERSLLSNESFFKRLNKDFVLDRLIEEQPDLTVKMLMFVRNPFDHAISCYHQFVKGKGYSKPFSEFLQGYKVPSVAAEYIKTVQTRSYCELVALNYGSNRAELLDRFAEFLEVPHETLQRPDRGVINRSMTRAELYLLSAFNGRIGDKARFLTNALCEATPNIKAQTPEATKGEIRDFYHRMCDETEALNEVLTVDQRIELPDLKSVQERFAADAASNNADLVFNREQIDAIVEAVSARLAIED